jgi:beta-N-acetylhexosaminidase
MSFGKVPVYLLFFLILPFFASAQKGQPATGKEILKKNWVDSVYNQLNDTERIGQLFMVAAYSGGKDYNADSIRSLLQKHYIGGLIFMQGTPEAQAALNNEYQRSAQVPLFIGMDAEWGLGMRLTGVKDMPRAATMGATRDTVLAYRMGAAVAAQCKRLGVHINFAPVVDVNNNPDNPIINARSFGEDKKWVAKLGIAYMKGMQDNGVMACAKHFPGHGDTHTDSHKDLPQINKTLAELDTLELYPFKELIRNGVKSVMVAHLGILALETEPNLPTTLSKNTITGLLKTKMGFRGLIFTDAMNMDGLTKYFAPGEADLRAFMAGNDVMLFSQNVPVAIGKIKDAMTYGSIPEKELEQRVKRILAAKYDAGLSKWKPVEIDYATYDINKNVDGIRAEMANSSVTFVRDRNAIVDKLAQKNLHIGYVGVNAVSATTLYKQLQTGINDLKADWLPKGGSKAVADKVLGSMTKNDITIVAIHGMSFYPGGGANHGLDKQQVTFLTSLISRSDVIIVSMGNAYWLRNICDANSILIAYEDDSITQETVANVLLRRADAKGVLPVTPCEGMITEAGMTVSKQIAVAGNELRQTDFVEDAGVINPQALDKLNLFLQRSIVDGAFPGCRVVAAKDGKVFYNKAFGHFTYAKDSVVTLNTVYDIASVTKVLSTTLAVMRLYETGKIELDKTLGDYLSIVKGTNKAKLKLRDLLLHQAGLKSWIPFYKETVDEKGNPLPAYYSKTKDATHTIEVAKNLYMRSDYKDSIWKRILESPLENTGKYVYSDLDFYFLAAVAEQVTGQSIDKYVDEQFYKPLKLKRATFNPLKKYAATEIAPTELDIYFRKQLIHGYVHDQGAAMLGGVAGHAGIFATADDVATVFQMLINKGVYGNKRYFKKETVNYFTAYNSAISRRGLGFDKPDGKKDDAGPAGNKCSGYAFGHQGFTGTCAWADPETGVVFVFLSNRVNPSADNGKINTLSVRTIAQDYIYESLGLPVNNKRPEVMQNQRAMLK